MSGYGRILCPVDFSEPSHVGLEAAIELAREFSSELLILHVVAPVPVAAFPQVSPAFDVGSYRTQLTESAKERLADIVKEHIPADIAVRPLVVVGEAANQIVRTAEKEKAQLIVLSTHGESGWHRFLFGSVAEKVVRNAGLPVLTIPEPADGS